MHMKKNSHIFLFFLILFFLFCNAGLAVDTQTNVTKTGTAVVAKELGGEKGYLANEIKNIENPAAIKSPSVVGTTINLILSLLFVIGLIYLVMVALKFFYVRTSIPLRTGGIITILAKEHIDSKSVLYVVEFVDRILLLGHAGGTINALSEIKDPEIIIQIKEKADEYISKYRMKNESKFSEELKASYLKQGQKIIDVGNKTVKEILNKFKKSDKK